MSMKSFKRFFNEDCGRPGCEHPVSDEEEIKNLGYSNGWYDNPPAEYIAHKENCCERVTPRPDYSYLKCPEVTTNIGRNLEEITCNNCGIKWKVDSSG